MGELQQQNTIQDTRNYDSKYIFTSLCKRLLGELENNCCISTFCKLPGSHELFIHSNLDNSYVKLRMRLPKNYDPDKRYPAFVALSAGNDGIFCLKAPSEQNFEEDWLCFDVTGRGYTGGSYIGEASTFEILNWIKANYKLDEDRLYFLGHSNGGFSTYAFAQNHPSLPAAIYPLIGYPQVDTIENISNLPTYQMVSNKDHVFVGRESEISGKLKQYGNYYQYNFKEMLHLHQLDYLMHKQILHDMLTYKRNPYPETVIFKTCRNRHLQSFWIKLHGISFGKQFGKIKAQIIDSNTIKITASDITGVTITLPPQINKDSFDVIIQNKIFHFDHYTKGRIMFKKSKAWDIVEQEGATDICKGTGLLDVYLNSLRIILSDDADDSVLEIADRFAHPCSNGYEAKIYVNYPIYREQDVPRQIFGYNLILFDNCYNNQYVKRLANCLPIQYDRMGYEYQGVRYDGDYVIMQVIQNPYDRNLSILVVSTNNQDLLKQHVLLRKVVIPTYSSGIHRFWNNEALIYDGKQYRFVYEQNAPLTIIESRSL